MIDHGLNRYPTCTLCNEPLTIEPDTAYENVTIWVCSPCEAAWDMDGTPAVHGLEPLDVDKSR